MKGILYKSKDGWMIKYTTYKTIPGIKGVMGSHSRMPESKYLPVHPDTELYPDGLWGQANVDEFETVEFEIVEQFMPYDNLNPVHKFAKLINEEKNKKRRQKKHTNIMEHNNIKRMYTEDDMAKKLYEFGKLVLDTFHSEGRTHSGEDRLARIKFDEWFNQLNKKDNE
jgi:hypothetical protein